VSTTKTTAGRASAPAAKEKILTALRKLGKASATQISEHAQLAYSTTTARLRSLEAAGQARRQRQPDGSTIWQPGDVAAGTTATQPPPEATTARRGTPNAGRSKPSSRRTPPSGARTRHKAASGERTASSGAGPGRAQSDTATNAAGAAQGARRPKGALRAEVLAVLQDHPDYTFKVSQVGKHLPGASAGAIANALDKLVADGTARRVSDRPVTYQAE
jgi:hypothetical protein